MFSVDISINSLGLHVFNNEFNVKYLIALLVTEIVKYMSEASIREQC